MSDESLEALIERFGRREIDDPFFGQLSYMMGGHHQFSWKGAVYFEPIQKKIELYIRLNREELPTENEREFYREIESKYAMLRELIAEKHLFIYMKSIQPRFKKKNIWNIFTLTVMSVPGNQGNKRSWNLDFASSLDSHYYSVSMSDWSPRGLLVNHHQKTFDV